MTASGLGTLFLDRVRWIAGAKAGPAAVAQTVLTRVSLLFINLANGIFTARHFGAEGRGVQAAIGLWLVIFTFAFTLGVPSALRYHGRKHQADAERLFGTSILLSLALGTLAAIAGILLMPRLMHNYGGTNTRDAQYVLLFAPLGMLTLVFAAMLEVRLDFTFANFTRYAPPIFTFATLVLLGRLHDLTPFSAVLAYVVPPAFISAATGVYLIRGLRPAFDDLGRSTRRLIGYGVRIFGADILGTFGQQIDQLLVVALLSAGELGAYTIALQASRVLTIFQTSLNSVLLPKAAGLPTHRVLELVARTARLTIAITAIAGLVLILLLPRLLPGLYGRDFVSAIIVSQILAVEAVFSAGASTHTQAFTATNRPGMATVFQFGGLATAVPLMLLLIPRLGLIGAALALLTSTFLRLALAIASYPLLLRAPVPKLIVTGEDVRYLLRSLKGSRSESTGTA